MATCLALMGTLGGCAGGGGEPNPSGSSGAPEPSGPPGASTPATSAQPSPTSARTLRLVDGAPQRACGITVSVKFIPPSATGNTDWQAFLVGGPPPSGDQPAPGTIAPAHTGAIATVLGQRFTVVAVDPTKRSITVDPLC